MNGLLLITQQALQLLLYSDAELWSIVLFSFSVSLKAILLTTPFALLLAFGLNHGNLQGIRIILVCFNSLLSVPTVVVGIFLYVLLTRQGTFDDLKLLFSQSAIVIGQMILCFPVLVALGYAVIQAADRRVWGTDRILGAPTGFTILTIFYEVRFGLLTAVLTGFGRVISEVGISMIMVGNIMGYTRNITTAIALETSNGEFAQGIALGLVLLSLAFMLTAFLSYIQIKKRVTT